MRSATCKYPSKYVLVKAKGGMGNRILCTITGLLYGRLTGRCAVVDWRDVSYSDDGSNVFDYFFDCPQAYSEEILPETPSIRPSLWKGKLHRSMSSMIHEFDPDKHQSCLIHKKYSVDIRKLDYPEDVVVFWHYTGRIKDLMCHLNNNGDDYADSNADAVVRKVLTSRMRLSERIRQRIDDFKRTTWPEKVIGVHIRHTDRKIPLAKYQRNLRRLTRRHPDAHIFLATDSCTVAEEFRCQYKNVFSTDKWFPRGSASMHQNPNCPDKRENGVAALVDMYLLADCDCLIYSSHSTFSLISRIMSNAPYRDIVDVDRYNPRVRIKRLIRELAV